MLQTDLQLYRPNYTKHQMDFDPEKNSVEGKDYFFYITFNDMI